MPEAPGALFPRGLAFSGDDYCKDEAQVCVRSASYLWLFIYCPPIHTIRDGVIFRSSFVLEVTRFEVLFGAKLGGSIEIIQK